MKTWSEVIVNVDSFVTLKKTRKYRAIEENLKVPRS